MKMAFDNLLTLQRKHFYVLICDHMDSFIETLCMVIIHVHGFKIYCKMSVAKFKQQPFLSVGYILLKWNKLKMEALH